MRTLFMTGATRGIGRHAALAVLRRHPDVHLVVTSRSGSGALAAELSAAGGRADVSEVRCELDALRGAQAAAEAVCAMVAAGEVPPLDALLLNAGTQLRTGASRTPDGFETTFAVSRFAWRTLLPLATLTPFATTARRADELLAAASVGSRPGESGDYLDLGRSVRSSAESYDVEREEQLWTEANRLCADALGRA